MKSEVLTALQARRRMRAWWAYTGPPRPVVPEARRCLECDNLNDDCECSTLIVLFGRQTTTEESLCS